MDAELMATLDSIANKDGVKGVLLADDTGLCLGARGIAKPAASAFVASIANTALELSERGETEDKSQYPTIHLEYEHHKLIIRNEGAFTLAIFT
ncbi:protein HBXIP [Phycomyces nitens]|nr:protein HBXIP [Phycomyces nitens]